MLSVSDPLVSVIIVTFNRKAQVIECLDSVLRSAYKPLEIIVVDNASVDGTADALCQRYADKMKLLSCPKNIYAGGGRNLGAKQARGEYLLFIDSDNVIAPDMIEKMISGIRENKELNVGVAGPFTYFKSERNKLCWTNSDISLLTSVTVFKGRGEIDRGQYSGTKYIRVGHIQNVFMVKKEAFEAAGGIDGDYVMHYEESDLAEKIKRRGYDVVLLPLARTWHDLPQVSPKGHKSFSGKNPAMVYYVSRNRIIFMRKNSSGARLFIFLTLFSNLFFLYNLAILALNRKFNLMGLLIKGYLSGIFDKITMKPALV